MNGRHQRSVCLHRAPEEILALQDRRLDEDVARRGENGIALVHGGQAQQDRGVDERQQLADLQVQVARQAVQVHGAASLGDHLEESREGSDPRVRQGDGTGAHARRDLAGDRSGEELIELVGEGLDVRVLARSRPRKLHREIGTDAARIVAEDDDAVGKQDGFLDVVGD